MSSPSDWIKFYQQNVSGDEAGATSASTGITIPSNNNILSSPLRGSGPSSSSNLLSPSDGRVSKPSHARRRSRASRRTPTTLLNTDTTNFRAMVQQFTGGPNNAPFALIPPAQSFGFGIGAAGNRHPSHHLLHNPNPNPNPNSSLMFSPSYRFQHQQPPQSQSQGYMISMSNVNNYQGGAAGDGLFQRLGGNPRPPPPLTHPAEGSDGFLMNYVPSSSTRVPTSSNENRGNGFMF